MKTINSFRSKLLALTLALMASVSTFAQAPDFKVGELYYKVLEGDTVEVTYRQRPASPTGDSTATPKKNSEGLGYENFTEVVIPSMITYEDKTYHVTRIGHGTFWLCDKLTYVDIPNTIKSIGIAAFRSCRTLASITLNEGLESIEHHAFYDCVRLKEVTLPSTLKTMGQSIFAFSTDLEKVTCKAIVPPTVEKDVLTDTDNYNAAIIANATLYVPAESLEAYKTAAAWKEFGQILPIESTTSYKSQWCNQWNILSHGYFGPQDPLAGARTSIYWLSNNTVNRNGQEYIPLMCSSSLPNEESTHFVGELRFTEDKQVYFYYAFDETEYLLYDFGAELGDTLELFAGLEFYNYHKTYTHVITDKEILDDGRLQIQADVVIRIDNGAGEYFEEKHPVTWIEGLGSTYGIIFNPSNPGVGGDGAIIMLCAYRDDECVYKTDSNDPYWIDYTQLGCVYNEGDFIEGAFPILSGLQRTVYDEFCGEAEIGAVYTGKQTFDKIFFENNKPYILCNDYLLREEDNKILIYSQLLNKDLVLYDFTLEVGDSLPALYIDYHARNAMDWMPYNPDVVDYNIDFDGTIYPADTFVVTDISNVTLLDGKEYKKWTFDNGMEYVEGIGMYGGRRNGNFFGLIQEVVVPCHIGTHLVCVSKNNKLLYMMDDAEMERLGAECLCDYDRGPRKDNAKDGQIGGRPTPTQWNQLEVEFREMENGNTILQAETFSYTLEDISQQVNSKTYFQLARQSTKDTATTKSIVGALHFGKEEDNRVYFLRDGVEYVLYDFTAEPGDTIEIFAGINNYPQETTYTHVVVDKDTTEDGACRMFLEVVFPDETATATNVEKVWLAGLGSIDGVVHNSASRATKARSSETQTSVMLCAWRDDDCLYTTNHPDYNSYGCVYNQDPTAVEDVETLGTPYQKILRAGHLYILRDNKLYDVLGTPVNKN